VLNQSCDHWLLSDASHSTLTISFKLKEEVKTTPSANNLMEDDSKLVIELALFASNIKKKSVVLDYILSFYTNYEK